MADVKIHIDPTKFRFDLPPLENNDLATDSGLENAVIISLFTDRRVDKDEIPEDQDNPRGWWAEAVDPLDDEPLGSRLWLLDRNKTTPETLNQIREYSTEALQWMINQGVAETVEVEAEYTDKPNGRVLVSIDISRPDGKKIDFEFDLIWREQFDGV